jgi:hypothetical protein
LKTFLTILASVIVAVAVTLLIQRHERKPDSASNGVASQNFVRCGLDTNGHIVGDGKGGCIHPPPSGYIIEVPIPEGAVIAKYPVKRAVSAEELERTCPWKAPVSEACQNLYALPNGVSCIGKPFNICIGGERP